MSDSVVEAASSIFGNKKRLYVFGSFLALASTAVTTFVAHIDNKLEVHARIPHEDVMPAIREQIRVHEEKDLSKSHPSLDRKLRSIDQEIKAIRGAIQQLRSDIRTLYAPRSLRGAR